MKKFLPNFFSFICVIGLLFSITSRLAFAAPAAPPPTPAPLSLTGSGATDSRWVIDPEVTFIGKNARRSGDLLDWTLQNYNWVCVKQVSTSQCDNTNNPIAKYW